MGGQVELAVYASTITGQPPEEDIIWKDPDNTTLEDDQSGVQFQTSKRRLILSDLTTSHSGVYRCIVIYSLAGTDSYGEAHIELKVFGKCTEHVQHHIPISEAMSGEPLASVGGASSELGEPLASRGSL